MEFYKASGSHQNEMNRKIQPKTVGVLKESLRVIVSVCECVCVCVCVCVIVCACVCVGYSCVLLCVCVSGI